MKKISTLLLFFSLTLIFSKISYSQVIDFDDPNRNVYWFEVNVRTTTDKETGFDKYMVIRMGKRVLRGNLDKFDEALWSGMSAGTKITIGPFSIYEDAYAAMLMYDLKDTTKYEDGDEKFWFLVNVNITERSKSYEFERMAAAIASGNINEFKGILEESLAFKTLAIGPFANIVDAEEAKRRYRLEE